jgi:hypothetical protein
MSYTGLFYDLLVGFLLMWRKYAERYTTTDSHAHSRMHTMHRLTVVVGMLQPM